jgi:hypothetical protein
MQDGSARFGFVGCNEAADLYLQPEESAGMKFAGCSSYESNVSEAFYALLSGCAVVLLRTSTAQKVHVIQFEIGIGNEPVNQINTTKLLATVLLATVVCILHLSYKPRLSFVCECKDAGLFGGGYGRLDAILCRISI